MHLGRYTWANALRQMHLGRYTLGRWIGMRSTEHRVADSHGVSRASMDARAKRQTGQTRQRGKSKTLEWLSCVAQQRGVTRVCKGSFVTLPCRVDLRLKATTDACRGNLGADLQENMKELWTRSVSGSIWRLPIRLFTCTGLTFLFFSDSKRM